MRYITLFILSVVAFCASAQEPEGGVEVQINTDDPAMEVLRRYADIAPHHYLPDVDFNIRAWRPHGITFVIPPSHLDRVLWQESATMPAVRIVVPKFTDYNSLRLNFGSSGKASITISNGSAYNYMPWNNSPIGYRDARTLSFPVPRR